VAACGGFVPMISGRGLGHTGGTLDKLESIPGYRATPDLDLLHRVVRETGCAIIGQTADLAPSDRRLYAVRDVTATIESIPLITASILAKKLAAGLQGLVMDVKSGSGAFLPDPDRARALARSIVETARGAGLPCRALLTDMSQCLGRTAGNALEVEEAVALLQGKPVDRRLADLVEALAAEVLHLGGLARDPGEGLARAREALASGAAAERFAAMVAALGGPRDILERSDRHLPRASCIRAVDPPGQGIVQAIDARALGLAVVALGGGRTRPDGRIDHAVGLSEVAAIGEPVGAGRPLALVHARDEPAADRAGEAVRRAFRLDQAAVTAGPVVIERLAEPG
jgi:thymidine phosphorylase